MAYTGKESRNKLVTQGQIGSIKAYVCLMIPRIRLLLYFNVLCEQMPINVTTSDAFISCSKRPVHQGALKFTLVLAPAEFMSNPHTDGSNYKHAG